MAITPPVVPESPSGSEGSGDFELSAAVQGDRVGPWPADPAVRVGGWNPPASSPAPWLQWETPATPPIGPVVAGLFVAATYGPAAVDAAATGFTQAQVDQLEASLGTLLAGVADDIVDGVLAERLPIVGDNLATLDGADAAALDAATAMGVAVRAGLATLAGASSYTATQVEAAIDNALLAAGFSGSGVTIDLGNASDLRLAFEVQRAPKTIQVPVESDLGLPNLGLAAGGTAQTTVTHQVDLVAGIDGQGVYLAAGAGAGTISLGTVTRLPGFDRNGGFGDLPVRMVDDAGNPTSFTGNFAIAIADPGGDGRLRPAELTGDVVDATLTGQAGIRLDLDSALPAGGAMPQFGTDLTVVWSFAGDRVDPDDDNASFGSVPDVRLADSTINLGSFFNRLAGPALAEIGRVTGPLAPVIDILTTPIPILSDLGSSKVTLLDFAGLSPQQTAAIEGLADIAGLAERLGTFTGNESVQIDLGSLRLDADLRSEPVADALLAIVRQPGNLAFQDADLAVFLSDLAALGGGGLSFPVLTDQRAIGQLLLGQDVDLFSYRAAFGFDEAFSQYFPVLGFAGVRLGGRFGLDAVFDFGYDTQGLRDYVGGGSVDAATLWNGFFVRASDDAGLPVTGFQIDAGITAALEANFGFASTGVEGDLTATIDFALDGALDPDGDGKVRGSALAATPPLKLFDPGGQLSSGLRAYLEVGISPFSIEFSFDSPRVVLLNFDGDDDNHPVLASALGGGELALNVGPRSPQRLVGNLEDIAERFEVSNVALFPDGDPVGLRVSGLGIAQSSDLASRITANGGERGDELVVAADVAAAVMFSGGPGRDLLAGGAAADQLLGDAGPDVLSGRGGNDTLLGGADADRLGGGAGADRLDGGDGNDTATYADASAAMRIDLRTMTLTGDGAGDVFVSIERWEATPFADTIDGSDASNMLLAGQDGNDTIRGHGGDDVLDGGKGLDSVDGGAGRDYVVGGPDADTLAGGDGVDTLAYTTSRSPVAVSLATGSGSGGDAQGDVLTGFEVLIGSPLPFGDLSLRRDLQGRPITAGTGDTLEGGAGPDTISGLGGADSIAGGDGHDSLFGDAAGITGSLPSAPGYDEDTLRGGAGNDTLMGQSDADDLDGGSGVDSLDGGDGDDHLRSLDLGSVDTLEGGAGTNRLSADFSDKAVAIRWTAGQTHDHAFADGDVARNFQQLGELRTGNLADVIVLDNDADDGFSNALHTNGGNDLVRAGLGFDTILGGAGNDTLYGGVADSRDGNDSIDAGPGNDYVNGGDSRVTFIYDSYGTVIGHEGGPGDQLHGGDGVDTVSFDQLRKTVTYIGIGIDNGKVSQLGVYVNLATNVTGRAAEGIVISGFENVIGTDGGDTLIGNELDNVFQPLRGGGLVSGSTGGPDYIDGGGGTDTLVIDFSLADLPEARGVRINATSISRVNLDSTRVVDGYNYGNVEQLRLTGASKDDQLYAWAAGDNADWLSGLAGNDTLGGKGGSDTLLGGDGDDVITAQGAFDLGYNGVAGGRDLISGGAGNDTIENIAFGSAGPALAADALFRLDGGAGFDILSADFSNQTAAMRWNSATPAAFEFADGAYARGFEQLRLFASGSGNDEIRQAGRIANGFWLGAGNDTVDSGLGIDTLVGGDGIDLLVIDYSVGDTPDMAPLRGGGDSNYWFRPTAADAFNRPDSVWATGFERARVTGTRGNDSFGGTWGDDTLIGGDGDDVLDGTSGGNNSISGGNGNDSLRGSWGIHASGRDDTLVGGEGNDTLAGLTGNDRLLGGAGNDVLSGEYFGWNQFGADTFSGGDGNDLLLNIVVNSGYTYAEAGAVMRMDGGTGEDTLSADYSNQGDAITFTGGVSNDITFANGAWIRGIEVLRDFLSGKGNDRITQPGRVDNMISGGEGNDTIAPGLGRDVIHGGAGDDLLVVDYRQGDGADVSGVTFDGTYLVRTYTASGTVIDRLTAPGFERFQIVGGGKADRLPGTYGADTLTGGGGDDSISGDAGNDRLSGGSGADTLDGGSGSDTLTGGAGADLYIVDAATDGVVEAATAGEIDTVRASVGFTLPANVERLELTGFGWIDGTGNDAPNVLTGNAGANRLDGGNGADTLAGGAGSDTLTGGAGNDTYEVTETTDVVVETGTAAGETDTVRSTVTWTLGDRLERLVLLGDAAIDGTGNALANVVTGNALANRITGQAGNDTLFGGLGTDTLQGSTGADRLDGGGGADRLAGGTGSDTLTGGSAADVFVLDAASGVDTITDFGSGTDKLSVLQSALRIGDGDRLVEGAVRTAGPGGFGPGAELVVVTTDIAGGVTTASAAAAIGAANAGYTIGRKVLFAVDDGAATSLFLFTAADGDRFVEATELQLLARLDGTASTALADYVFG